MEIIGRQLFYEIVGEEMCGKQGHQELFGSSEKDCGLLLLGRKDQCEISLGHSFKICFVPIST